MDFELSQIVKIGIYFMFLTIFSKKCIVLP